MQSVPLRLPSRVYAVFLAAISMAPLILLIMLAGLALPEEASKQAYAERGVRVAATIVGFDPGQAVAPGKSRPVVGQPLVELGDKGFSHPVKVSRTPPIPPAERPAALGTSLQAIYLPGDPNSVIPVEALRHFGGLAAWWVKMLVVLLLLVFMLTYAARLWKQNDGGSAP